MEMCLLVPFRLQAFEAPLSAILVLDRGQAEGELSEASIAGLVDHGNGKSLQKKEAGMNSVLVTRNRD